MLSQFSLFVLILISKTIFSFPSLIWSDYWVKPTISLALLWYALVLFRVLLIKQRVLSCVWFFCGSKASVLFRLIKYGSFKEVADGWRFRIRREKMGNRRNFCTSFIEVDKHEAKRERERRRRRRGMFDDPNSERNQNT